MYQSLQSRPVRYEEQVYHKLVFRLPFQLQRAFGDAAAAKFGSNYPEFCTSVNLSTERNKFSKIKML